jgi:hypothetical protein
MKKPKRSRGDRDNNPKHSFSVTRGNFGRVAPLHMTGTTPQWQPKVDADMAAGEEAVSPVTQPAAAVDSATTQNNVSRGDVASETAQSSAAGFPGEILENTEATSVDAYAVEISTAWHRTVNAVMTTAQFCARADARLTLQQKQELIGKLPFGEETFSKLVGIGNDLRLRQPEIQRRLPPYYTSIYVITTFNPDEFRLAVDLQVIHAEVTCGELEQWRNEHRQEAQEEQVAARTAESNSAETDTAAQVPANSAPELGIQGEVPASAVEVPSPKIHPSPEPMPAAAGDVTNQSPSVAPTGDENGKAADSKDDTTATNPERQTNDSALDEITETLSNEQGAVLATLKSSWTDVGILKREHWEKLDGVVQRRFVRDILLIEEIAS